MVIPSHSDNTSPVCSPTLDLNDSKNSSPDGSVKSKIQIEHDFRTSSSQPGPTLSTMSEKLFEGDLPEGKTLNPTFWLQVRSWW